MVEIFGNEMFELTDENDDDEREKVATWQQYLGEIRVIPA